MNRILANRHSLEMKRIIKLFVSTLDRNKKRDINKNKDPIQVWLGEPVSVGWSVTQLRSRQLQWESL